MPPNITGKAMRTRHAWAQDGDKRKADFSVRSQFSARMIEEVGVAQGAQAANAPFLATARRRAGRFLQVKANFSEGDGVERRRIGINEAMRASKRRGRSVVAPVRA